MCVRCNMHAHRRAAYGLYGGPHGEFWRVGVLVQVSATGLVWEFGGGVRVTRRYRESLFREVSRLVGWVCWFWRGGVASYSALMWRGCGLEEFT